MDRGACREHVARWFSAEATADGYEQAYAAVLERSLEEEPMPIFEPPILVSRDGLAIAV